MASGCRVQHGVLLQETEAATLALDVEQFKRGELLRTCGVGGGVDARHEGGITAGGRGRDDRLVTAAVPRRVRGGSRAGRRGACRDGKRAATTTAAATAAHQG